MDTEFLTWLLVGISVYLLWLLRKCGFSVEQGYIATLTDFGRANFEDESKNLLKIYEPGFHLKLPWVRVHKVSIMEQFIDLAGEEKGIPAMAADGTILRLDTQVRFHVIKEALFDYLFVLRHPIDHLRDLFTCLIRNEIANFGDEDLGKSLGSYALIRQERLRLNRDIHSFCQDRMSSGYGVQFDGVDLTDILPPRELQDALNAVISAKNAVLTHLSKAEAQAEQRILSSHRAVEIATEKANATETEISVLGGYLKQLHESKRLQDYVQRRRSEVHGDARAIYVRRES